MGIPFFLSKWPMIPIKKRTGGINSIYIYHAVAQSLLMEIWPLLWLMVSWTDNCSVLKTGKEYFTLG